MSEGSEAIEHSNRTTTVVVTGKDSSGERVTHLLILGMMDIQQKEL